MKTSQSIPTITKMPKQSSAAPVEQEDEVDRVGLERPPEDELEAALPEVIFVKQFVMMS